MSELERVAAALVTGAENMDGVGGLAERARIFRHLSAVIRSALREAEPPFQLPAHAAGPLHAFSPYADGEAIATIPTLHKEATLHEADEYADMALQAHELRECLARLYDYAAEVIEVADEELDGRVRQALGMPARPPVPLVPLRCTCDAGMERSDPALHALSCPMRDKPNA